MPIEETVYVIMCQQRQGSLAPFAWEVHFESRDADARAIELQEQNPLSYFYRLKTKLVWPVDRR